MIKVLVVEDSLIARELIVRILSADANIKVIGTAANGEEALKHVRKRKPDVITMDINMPKLSGFETTRIIMETTPVPIIIVTASWDPKEVATSFGAVEAGAVALLEKPPGIGSPEHEVHAKELLQTVKLMSEVKVVRRMPALRRARTAATVQLEPEISQLKDTPRVRIVAIGASTGGPQVLHEILSGLQNNFPAPLLIVQHIAPGFLRGMADWLEETTGLACHIPIQNERLLPGHVYLAPEDIHMGVISGDRILLSGDLPENGTRPAVSYLFRSVACVYKANAVGVLLSGMGRDGAKELGLIKANNAVTIAQNEASSVVFGMPGEAIRLDAARFVLAPGPIAQMLNQIAGNR